MLLIRQSALLALGVSTCPVDLTPAYTLRGPAKRQMDHSRRAPSRTRHHEPIARTKRVTNKRFARSGNNPPVHVAETEIQKTQTAANPARANGIGNAHPFFRFGAMRFQMLPTRW